MPIMPPPTYLAFYRPLRPSGTSPNLGEESGCGYDKRKCENGNVKGVVSLQTVIAICTLSPVSVLCPNRKDLKRL